MNYKSYIINPTFERKRNIGIDALRICSMLMVVVLHILGNG